MDTTNKHAYLIIAHNEPEVFKILIELLDFEYNDIFVHIDKKSDITLFNSVKTTKSSIYFLEKRNDVRWGDISQIKTELDLFEYAHSVNNYSFYHLISGVDLPTKNIITIYNFFENNKGKEFFSLFEDEDTIAEINEKTNYHFLFMKNFKSKNIFIKAIRACVINIEKAIHFHRNYNMELKKGFNWISCTNDFTEYLLACKKELLKKFNYTCCCDEIYKHSLLWNSKFKNNLYIDKNSNYSCMRQIDWERGDPYIWKQEDINSLLSSDSMFARKFSSSCIDLEEFKKLIKENK